MTIGEMIKGLRDVVDARDSLSNQDSELARQEAELKYQLQCKAQEQGVPGFKSPDGSFTVAEDLRAKYCPEAWDSIVKWAVESGNSHIIQRRMTDARVKALMLEGTVLPDGLTLEPYIKTSFRRN